MVRNKDKKPETPSLHPSFQAHLHPKSSISFLHNGWQLGGLWSAHNSPSPLLLLPHTFLCSSLSVSQGLQGNTCPSGVSPGAAGESVQGHLEQVLPTYSMPPAYSLWADKGEGEKALTLWKLSSAVAWTLVCYQCGFNCKCRAQHHIVSAMRKVNCLNPSDSGLVLYMVVRPLKLWVFGCLSSPLDSGLWNLT